MQRTAQDLLAERRSNILERERETDPIARATLAGHIAELDLQLAAIGAKAPTKGSAK